MGFQQRTRGFNHWPLHEICRKVTSIAMISDQGINPLKNRAASEFFPFEILKENCILDFRLERVHSGIRKILVWPKSLGFWWCSGKEPACQCRKHKRRGFDPWVGKIPWRRAWQRTPVFLPGESHGQRSLAGCSPWGRKELDTTQVT